jgi:hypothetical protein
MAHLGEIAASIVGAALALLLAWLARETYIMMEIRSFRRQIEQAGV